jgi:DNA-binding response OmpR family regulator
MENKSILLVDDEAIILYSFGRDLEHEGYDVTSAASGEEAIDRLREKKYDLVITDLVMTGAGGIEVLKEAKKIDPATGVFILTGYADMTSAVDALRLGADDYLQKPVDTDEMLIRINRCLERQEAWRKIQVYEKIIPVCCMCGMIRDDTGVEPGQGEWLKTDMYIHKKTTAEVSHCYCPTCSKKARQDFDSFA